MGIKRFSKLNVQSDAQFHSGDVVRFKPSYMESMKDLTCKGFMRTVRGVVEVVKGAEAIVSWYINKEKLELPRTYIPVSDLYLLEKSFTYSNKKKNKG